MTGSALVDPTGTYRYWLTREWLGGVDRACFVMLNPSSADAARDDPTIRRVVGFAKRDGYASVEVVNLYALRATNPRELTRHPDPVGADNAEHVRRAMARASVIVCAWGAAGLPVPGEVAPLLADHVLRLRCLGLTRDLHPRHPLFVRSSQRLLPYDLRWAA